MGRPDLHVTVVYCAPGHEDVTELVVQEGATVGDAIGASGVLARNPEVTAARPDVGVWGRSCDLARRLEDGDRVELYRPLTVDPKEARRVRAEIRRRRGKA